MSLLNNYKFPTEFALRVALKHNLTALWDNYLEHSPVSVNDRFVISALREFQLAALTGQSFDTAINSLQVKCDKTISAKARESLKLIYDTTGDEALAVVFDVVAAVAENEKAFPADKIAAANAMREMIDGKKPPEGSMAKLIIKLAK